MADTLSLARCASSLARCASIAGIGEPVSHLCRYGLAPVTVATIEG